MTIEAAAQRWAAARRAFIEATFDTESWMRPAKRGGGMEVLPAHETPLGPLLVELGNAEAALSREVEGVDVVLSS